jgi:uncharacterized membrane protein YjjP (DUF1212 family)
MKHPRSRPTAWLLLAFIIFATVCPISVRPHDYLPVEVDRALAFFLMTGAFVVAYPNRWLSVTLMCIAGAFGIEALQFLSETRHPELADAMVKAVGAALGASLGIAFNAVRRRALGWRQTTPSPAAESAIASLVILKIISRVLK